MSIMLSRILSLIPRDESGKYKHGAKAEFARSIGYDSGDIIAMWENGSSTSYKRKLHEIAAKYGVSVEWLKGETDEKTPPAGANGVSEKDRIILELSKQLSEDQKDLLIAQLKILGAQK